MNAQRLHRRIRIYLVFFIAAVMISGITAFPLEAELGWLNENRSSFPAIMQEWITTVYAGVHYITLNYPFLHYGTDWLAFAHIVIAIAFIGPLRDPVKNKWVVQWGIINCILVFPLAFIAGGIRNIPFFHQLIDCAFGVVGLIPLLIVHRDINRLEKLFKLPEYSYN